MNGPEFDEDIELTEDHGDGEFVDAPGENEEVENDG